MGFEVSKRLSANDIGETGSHQAGILVPKEGDVIKFFPSLASSTKNPRADLHMREKSDGTLWLFKLIYYNSKFFGGTRNEYRLTCMTKYLRMSGANVGDELAFSRDIDGNYLISLRRASRVSDSSDTLVLTGGWKIISY